MHPDPYMVSKELVEETDRGSTESGRWGQRQDLASTLGAPALFQELGMQVTQIRFLWDP